MWKTLLASCFLISTSIGSKSRAQTSASKAPLCQRFNIKQLKQVESLYTMAIRICYSQYSNRMSLSLWAPLITSPTNCLQWLERNNTRAVCKWAKPQRVVSPATSVELWPLKSVLKTRLRNRTSNRNSAKPISQWEYRKMLYFSSLMKREEKASVLTKTFLGKMKKINPLLSITILPVQHRSLPPSHDFPLRICIS
jgi:hypothetical protein